ncbi:MAG: HDIG domain-containing protein [Leptospiraceae bacterium]|nr:HDIG domain-containing protein [Leptospiraceae bacterium]
MDLQQKLDLFQQYIAQSRSPAAIRKVILVLFIFTFLAAFITLGLPFLEIERAYQIGDIAQEDVRLSYEIRYLVSEETKRRQEEAYRRERVVFDRNEEQYQKLMALLGTEYELFHKTAKESPKLELFLTRFPFLKNKKFYSRTLLLTAAEEIRQSPTKISVDRIAEFLYRNYVVLPALLPQELMREIELNAATLRTKHSQENNEDLVREANRFLLIPTLNSAAIDRLMTHMSESRPKSALIRLWLLRAIELFGELQVFSYNELQTIARKEAARKSVKPVWATLPRGLYILRQGDVVDRDAYHKLEIIRQYQKGVRLRALMAYFLVLATVAFGTAYFMYRLADFFRQDVASHLILHSLLFAQIILAYLLRQVDFISQWKIPLGVATPIAFFSIMTSLLLNPRITLIAGIFLATFLFFFSQQEAETFLFALTALFTGSYTAERMQRRTQVWKGAFTIGMVNTILVIASHLWKNQDLVHLKVQIATALLNAIGCVVLVMLALPLYENVLNLATKFRLLELADVNNPLLRQLAEIAPSTYSHSLMMANLSEKAVAALGGDVLLTRVGCLYHDIGKMKNPALYAENRHLLPTNESYRKLGPVKSAQMIIKHVTDGIQMARQHRLPEKVIAFIPEHHGTTTIQYFYHQALAAQNARPHARPVLKSLFQYPGPRPRSRETAVVMIADSVEAASRSLSETSRESFNRLVDEIIQNKLAEDQFDECGLTIADLKKIKESFVEVLLSHYHDRPSYPKMQETRNLELENAILLEKNRQREKTLSQRTELYTSSLLGSSSEKKTNDA